MRKAYAALGKANERMANANLKKRKGLLVKQEHFRQQAFNAKDINSSIKNIKKADKAGARAEGELKKANRRTQSAQHYKSVEVR